MHRSITAVGTLCAALVGCGDDGTTPDPVDDPIIALELVASDLVSPLYLTAVPGDTTRLFVVERGGHVRIVRDGSVLTTPFIDLTGSVAGDGEQGLLSMAFHPNYAGNGYFYGYYTDDQGDSQVVRYTVSGDPDVADPASALPILTVEQPETNHNGGLLKFGPDGTLYVGLGDGGGTADPDNHAQRPTTLLGSMLRLDVDAGSPYAIPADNPFVGDTTGADEVWAYGLRNPWRYSFDRSTGDLYIADVGEEELEEINFQAASSDGGENYGWRTMEGGNCFTPSSGCSMAGLTLPVHQYTHDDGCSITGGYVYRGSALPDLVGRYFYADFCSSWVRSLEMVGGVAENHVDYEQDLGPLSGISSFGEDARGELYLVTLGGSVYRLVPP